MNIYIISPKNECFSKKQLSILKKTGNIIWLKKIQPIGEYEILRNDISEKIIAIDPDSCQWKVENKEFESIGNLQAIILQSSSFDWIDVGYCARKNIPVVNTRDFANQAVVEWLIMMTLMVARKLPVIYQDGWQTNYNRHLGMEIFGKTAGIIGMGQIGSRLAQVCHTLGMRVIYWSKQSRNTKYTFNKLTTLFKKSDFIYPCLAKNIATEKIIQPQLFKLMKKNASIIAAYPQHLLFDTNKLINFVKTGKIYGLGFEYYGKENIQSMTNKKRANLLITPDLAWYTKESVQRNSEGWVKNIIAASKNQFSNRVN